MSRVTKVRADELQPGDEIIVDPFLRTRMTLAGVERQGPYIIIRFENDAKLHYLPEARFKRTRAAGEPP